MVEKGRSYLYDIILRHIYTFPLSFQPHILPPTTTTTLPSGTQSLTLPPSVQYQAAGRLIPHNHYHPSPNPNPTHTTLPNRRKKKNKNKNVPLRRTTPKIKTEPNPPLPILHPRASNRTLLSTNPPTPVPYEAIAKATLEPGRCGARSEGRSRQDNEPRHRRRCG